MAVVAIVIGVLATTTTPAAAVTFNVSGTVLDATGVPVANATVEAFTPGSTTPVATATSSASGDYQFDVDADPCTGGTFDQGACTVVVPATQGPQMCPVPAAENPVPDGCYREFARLPTIDNCVAPYMVQFTECRVSHDKTGKTGAEIAAWTCPSSAGQAVSMTTSVLSGGLVKIEACYYPLVTSGGSCPAGTDEYAGICIQAVGLVSGAPECPPGFTFASADTCVSTSPADGLVLEIRVTTSGASSPAASVTVVITGTEIVDFDLPADPTVPTANGPDPDPDEFEQVSGGPIVLDLPPTYFMDLEPVIEGVIAGDPIQCPTFSHGAGGPDSGYLELSVPALTALWINRSFDVSVTLEGPIAGTSSVAGAVFTSHDVFAGPLPASNTITANLDPAATPGTDAVVSQFFSWGGDYEVTFAGYTITGRRYETTCPTSITIGS